MCRATCFPIRFADVTGATGQLPALAARHAVSWFGRSFAGTERLMVVTTLALLAHLSWHNGAS